MAAHDTTSSWQIDCDFPGGNILVERQEGDQAWVKQDLRDTYRWWFYWHFRVRNAGGKILRFNFTEKFEMHSQGVCVSIDGGNTWHWSGPQVFNTDEQPGFSFKVPGGADEVHFAISFPYLEKNLQQLLADCPIIVREELCLSRRGRSVELLRLGNSHARRKLYLSARHHACESTASWVLEGLLREICAEHELGEWFRREIDIMVVPFVDKDGVEDGDQGKYRAPYDHNRDYDDDRGIYPEVAAIKKVVPPWSAQRQTIATDFHCPMIKTKIAHMVNVGDENNLRVMRRFVELLSSLHPGPGAFRECDHGEWKVGNVYTDGIQSTRWLCSLPNMLLSGTIEIPYSQMNDAAGTPAVFMGLGKSMAKAYRELWLEQESK